MKAKKFYNNSVKLGLDLSGGMNVIVRADLDAALESQMEVNKTMFLSREKSLDEKENRLEEAQKEFNGLIAELKEQQENYRAVNAEMQNMRDKFKKRFGKEIKRIKRQK